MVAGHSYVVTPVKITFSEQVTQDIYLFGFRRNFEFRAGQVIGIAPFFAMLQSGQAVNKTLIYGNRYLEQFHFHEEFSSVLGSQYIRCCTAERDMDVFRGRVTDYLGEHSDPDPNLKYYLCGSVEMVVDTRDILIEKGIPFDQIISEIYF